MFQIWTDSQRKVVLGVTTLLIVYLVVRAFLQPRYISDPPPVFGSRAHELADRIDPNTAEWTALAALPMIGEKRARDIVHYREQHAARNTGSPAFERIEDLMKVKGIGPAMIIHMGPHLMFPVAEATSQPAAQ